MWGWLMLDGLWVDAALRGRRLGARLLGEAEALARRRGCRAAWLDTFDFQARPFYERQGYRVVAALDGFPPGHTHYRLRKDLAPAARGRPGGSRLTPIDVLELSRARGRPRAAFHAPANPLRKPAGPLGRSTSPTP